MRRLETARSFNAVAAGQTATLDLPAVGIYHRLTLKYAESGTAANQATVEAGIDEIRLLVNGKVQRRMSAEQLIDINAYHGKAYSAGQLPIYFSEPWRRTTQGEDALAWGMADVSTFQIEVDIASGATSPTLELKEVREKAEAPMGPIVKWRQFQVPVSAVGLTSVHTFPKLDTYYALHCQSADVDAVKVEVNREEFVDGLRADFVDIADDHGYSFQTGYFHVDFGVTRRVADGLPMNPSTGPVRDFQVDFTMGAANSFTVITETLGLRD